ncbi:MAG TPA: LytR C-terminal domain-containing protein [Thermoleophilaceae bacterium]|nr:LytR C-terminal domain-containing protein [Thermoleophilaceae bacterium]
MHLVQEIGSYAGFAAVVGLAVLSALYFSQARDVKRLREWAGRAPERAAEQEARIAAQAQAQHEPRTAAAAAGGAATVAAPAVRPQAAPPAGTPAPPPPTLTSARAATPPPSSPILGSTLPDEPWYRRIAWPAPRYIALILVGVLVIGAGAAYGISKLNSGGGGSNAADVSSSAGGGSSGSHRSHGHRVVAVRPGSITVAVLNGTTVTGLAATVADKVEQAGFKRGNTNNALTQGQQAESVVEYSHGDKDQARLVANKLGISQIEPIDPQTQGLAGDATVTVIVGADKANGSG